MKLIIAGGRDFTDKISAQRHFLDFVRWNTGDSKARLGGIVEIVSGGARGADRCGEWVANFYKIPVKQFLPDWDGLGKKAGHVRNREMGDYADALLAFWDGKSTGTKGMIEYAQKKGLKVKVVRY
jgi:hypothetical protein